MPGPTTAYVRSGRAPSSAIAESAAGTTPAASPRRPAWTAATTPPRRSDRRIGVQSATRTSRATPRCRVTSASASGGAAGGSSTTATAAPCTCCIPTRAMPDPRAELTCSRLAATAAGSSPTCSARLRLAQGGRLTPPCRSVTATPTPTRSSRCASNYVHRPPRHPSMVGFADLLEEVGDVELVVVLEHDRAAGRLWPARAERLPAGVASHRLLSGNQVNGRVGAVGRRHRLRLADLRAARLVGAMLRRPTVEAGRDHGDPHLVAERVVD